MKKYIKSILAPRAAALAADYFFVPCNLGPSSAYSVWNLTVDTLAIGTDKG